MNLDALMNRIEDYEFAARLTIASDMRTFLRGANKQPEVQELTTKLILEDAQTLIIARIRRLLTLPNDPDMQHPADTAIAIYLLALAFKNPSDASRIAEEVLKVQNLWWAAQLARPIAEFNRSSSCAASEQSEELVEQLQGRSDFGQ